ncbi:hypothetical protein Fcan01_13512 [Folsomia candida]|uniref:Gustatory receptor n=2 Tax=Folsomia candida TaxID=158441 RepID=A0A226E4P4_FOLCA|nr:hypothetical protein Fcan01_13512 [Folsomia candida]
MFIPIVTSVRQKIAQSRDVLVLYYFDVFRCIVMLPYLLTYSVTLWSRSDAVKDVVKQSTYNSGYFGKNPSEPSQQAWWHRFYNRLNKVAFLCACAIILPVISTRSAVGDIVGDPIATVMNQSLQAKYSLFLKDADYERNSSNRNETGSELSMTVDNPSWDSILLYILHIISTHSKDAMDCFASLSIIISAITLLEAAQCFTSNLQEANFSFSTATQVPGILDQFYDLKKFSEPINRFVAPTTFFYSIVSISYMTVKFDDIAATMKFLDKFEILYFLINDAYLFFMAARVCQEMHEFWKWLVRRETRTLLSPEEMTTLLADVSTTPIGISGNGMFTIDHKFLGTIGITLITLFVIVLQVKK